MGPFLTTCRAYLQNKYSMWARNKEACLVWSQESFSAIATTGTSGQRGPAWILYRLPQLALVGKAWASIQIPILGNGEGKEA